MLKKNDAVTGKTNAATENAASHPVVSASRTEFAESRPARIEIMDTTLRDGEQTSGVSFMPHEKLDVARRLLDEVRVDRVEVASARVSDGERRAVSLICRWAEGAGLLDRVEVLGFVDGRQSVDWITSCGGRVINLLTKGSERHCTLQLRKTPQEHIDDIRRTLDYARRQGVAANVYLEDWSNGMKDSPDYVFALVDALRGEGVGRFLLPDTLGVLNPLTTHDFMRRMVRRYPGLRFDFHAHNDYDMAIANVFAAVKAGCHGIHTAVNGLGERAGNAALASVQAILKDHFGAQTGIDESRLFRLSRIVAGYSGIPIPSNAPITGESVFTQVAGVHADGDNKSGLYCNALLPERFGRRREYALGKNSGKANILRNLEELGLELTPDEARRVTRRIIELGDRKELVTQEDLPYIVADVLKHDAPDDRVKLVSYVVTTANGLRPCASLRISIDGTEYEASAAGDGQYDAFMRGLHKIFERRLQRKLPKLTNYAVTIPPGGRTDAFVQTVITWERDGREFRTRGLDADQTDAAIQATIRMLNLLCTAPKGSGAVTDESNDNPN